MDSQKTRAGGRRVPENLAVESPTVEEIELALKKIGYSGKSTILKNRFKFNKLLIKSFQRRFRPELINGKIDQECLLIINKLANIHN